MKILKITTLVILLCSTLSCTSTDKLTETHDNKPRYTVTVNFGNEIKTYNNVTRIEYPRHAHMTTILIFDDNTKMEIVGGTIWWKWNYKNSSPY